MTIQKMKPTKLVYGHGTNDFGGITYDPLTGKMIPAYRAWKSMLMRCYSKKYQDKEPTYRNCSVCPEWLSLSVFKAWHDENYVPGWELDKDILIPGNKVYRPEACRYVPGYLNSLLLDAGASRGSLPLGVTAVRSKRKNGQIITAYRAQCSDGKGGHPHKDFRTIPEAVAWYSTKKKEVVKEIVLDAFWRNEIMSDVATALLERKW